MLVVHMAPVLFKSFLCDSFFFHVLFKVNVANVTNFHHGNHFVSDNFITLTFVALFFCVIVLCLPFPAILFKNVDIL